MSRADMSDIDWLTKTPKGKRRTAAIYRKRAEELEREADELEKQEWKEAFKNQV